MSEPLTEAALAEIEKVLAGTVPEELQRNGDAQRLVATRLGHSARLLLAEVRRLRAPVSQADLDQLERGYLVPPTVESAGVLIAHLVRDVRRLRSDGWIETALRAIREEKGPPPISVAAMVAVFRKHRDGGA